MLMSRGVTVRETVSVFPLYGYVIALDPGHGGYDPGFLENGITEKEIVLEISLKLKSYLEQSGASVVMTRDSDRDLLEQPVGPKKHRDLSNRLKLVEESGSDILISVHANAISSPYWSGAQTFYAPGDEESKALALAIQQELIRVLGNTRRSALSRELFVLLESPVPAVIVEVGFMSNPDESRLLRNPAYQQRVAWALYIGIVRYLRS